MCVLLVLPSDTTTVMSRLCKQLVMPKSNTLQLLLLLLFFFFFLTSVWCWLLQQLRRCHCHGWMPYQVMKALTDTPMAQSVHKHGLRVSRLIRVELVKQVCLGVGCSRIQECLILLQQHCTQNPRESCARELFLGYCTAMRRTWCTVCTPYSQLASQTAQGPPSSSHCRDKTGPAQAAACTTSVQRPWAPRQTSFQQAVTRERDLEAAPRPTMWLCLRCIALLHQ